MKYVKLKGSSLSYLALGDSYTFGKKVSADQSWPAQLVRLLRSSGVQMKNPEILATTGWTTYDLHNAIRQTDLHPPYDLVSLLIGVNNQIQKLEVAEYSNQFQSLLEKAIRLSGNTPSRVLVLSIPDYSVTRFGRRKNSKKVSAQIAMYNRINRAITENLHAHYIDITAVSREAAEDGDLITCDGLHPSAKMYAEWAEKAAAVMAAEIKEWSNTTS